MKISIHYSFLFLIMFGLFADLLKEVLIFSSIIFIHELSHAFFAFVFKKKIKRITLTLIGGVIEIKGNNLSFLKEFIINISGILMNIILLLLSFKIKNIYYKELIYNFNMLMILINILPIYPLDSFRIFEDIIYCYYKSLKSFKNVILISLFCSIVFLIFGIFKKSYGLIIIGIFLVFKNISLKFQAETFFLMRKVNYY